MEALIKVIVVDDEYLAREGMKRTIDWAKFGCTFCGEAEDGYEGIELSKRIEPDIIITDINMPGMNGIQMAQTIKEDLPNCKFIIITGYDEFEYARAAIKLNAFDFLLKPVDETEFVSAVENAAQECRRIKENFILSMEKNFLNLMRGNICGSENINKILKENRINLNNLQIIDLQNDSFEYYTNNEIIKNVIRKYYNEEYVVECHEDKIAIIIGEAKDLDEKNIYDSIKKIQREIYEEGKIVITAGISNVNSVYDIKKAYKESKDALKYRMYLGRGSIIYYKNLKEENLVKWDNIIDREKDIIIKIKACDKIGLEKNLKNMYFELFREKNIDYNTVKQTSIEIISKSMDLLYEYNITPDKLFRKQINVFKDTFQLETINELYLYVKNILDEIICNIKETNIASNENGIEDALRYINEHFCENISLNDVAKVAFLSESYLSRKIKKTLGISFVEYITKLRMEKALLYLKDSNIKITDVALRLGYQDYRYFSQSFKKYTGYLPSEWKEKQLSKN